jgi:hypothetical protein
MTINKIVSILETPLMRIFVFFQLDSGSSPVTAISFIQPRLVPDHVEYEDDNEEFISPRDISPQPAATGFTTARRRVTDDKVGVVAPRSVVADEGDFILRRESDFGLRRNVARTSQRSDESAAVEKDGSTSSQDVVSNTQAFVTSRRTGLPTSRRVIARQREEEGSAQQVSNDPSSGGRVTADNDPPEYIEPAANDFDSAAAQRQTALSGRQRLRQELRKTSAVTEEPSSRAAAAEGRAASPSSRARTQLQRPRITPPESPLAVALPRSGHSASVDNAASQQVR